ncbi:hypothetical protein CBLAS_1291 [Campylobacter blaseri]|uniref:Uncharacterized protein n=1 Tax=Campylobacter blaseri TaxID=2042961 RepID=A0A2P8QYA9_9BACT|nr:hypothetical protein [Campylobacter blaseri]PSM51225.1 hypothetical protein CQ405_09210 [Campylobacter blaseri]PSM52374.1 hypothetical protein CRN67_09190 [Campylobacter blaseri]QKF86463.1 hypothetical protein CBLAS_1291 [Campylobacter blaseri]
MKQILTLMFAFFIFANLAFANDLDKSLNNYKNSNINKNLNQEIDELSNAIMEQDYNKIKTILDTNPEIINFRNSYNMLPIQVFFEATDFANADYKILEILLSYDNLLLSPAIMVEVLGGVLYRGDKNADKVMDKFIQMGLDNEKINSFWKLNWRLSGAYSNPYFSILYDKKHFKLYQIYLNKFNGNPNFGVFNSIGLDLFDFVRSRGFELKKDTKLSKKAENFLHSNEYINFRDEKMKWAYEYLKHIDYKDIEQSQKFMFEIFCNFTKDEKLKEIIKK